MHCSNILKNTFGYLAEQIIHHNLIMSIFQMVGYFFFTFLAFKADPLKIIKVRAWVFFPFVVIFPYLMQYHITPTLFFWLPALSSFFVLTATSTVAMIYKHLPVFKRFTYVSTIYAGSRALVYIITSFGLVYLTDFLGQWGSFVLLAPTTAAFIWAVHYFEQLRYNLSEFFG